MYTRIIKAFCAILCCLIMVMGCTKVYKLSKKLEDVKPKKAEIDIGSIKIGLYMYAEHNNGEYPTQKQGLEALITRPTSPPVPADWKGPYIDPADFRDFRDPWGNKYIYEVPSRHEGYDFDLYSLGADGQVGGTGNDADIANWIERMML